MNRAGYLLLAALSATACDAARPAEGNSLPAVAEVAPAGGVVDSILPIDEYIRRFQVTAGHQPKAFEGGAASRDALVAGYVRALETRDTAGLRNLLVTRSEFAYFYYPESMYTRKPYELSPDIVWMQVEHGTSSGITRALQRIGGKPLDLHGYDCPGGAKTEGGNTVWNDCTVRIGFADAEPARLFGSIIERAGVFKFLSYANRL